MAKYKVVYAKCPYCKAQFPWVHGFLGEYAFDSLNWTCEVCGNKSKVTAIKTVKFSAKKLS